MRIKSWIGSQLVLLGKRLGIDAHYYAKNSAVVTTGHVISTLRGIVTGYLVVLLLPRETYGEYQFVLSIVGTIGVLTLSGLPSSIARAVATRGKDAPLRSVAARYALLCVPGALVLLGTIALLPSWGREELWPLFVVAGLLFLPQTVASQIYGGIIRGNGRFRFALTVTIWTGAILTTAVLAMLFLYPSSLILLGLMMGVPAATATVASYYLLQEYSSGKKDDTILAYAWQLTIATIPVSLSWYVDKLLISALFGLNQLAVFSVAMLIPEQLKVWSKELFPIAFARQAKGKDSHERRRHLMRIVVLSTLLLAVGIGAYLLVTPYLVPLLFPHYPANDVILLTNVAAITLLTIPATLFPQYLEAQGMLRHLQWSHWSAAGAFVISLLILVPTMGLLGAVIARGIFRLIFALVAFGALLMSPVRT